MPNTLRAVAGAHELQERLSDARCTLSKRQQRVIELRTVRGLPFDEIARRMGLKRPSCARSLLSRALGDLARCLPAASDAAV